MVRNIVVLRNVIATAGAIFLLLLLSFLFEPLLFRPQFSASRATEITRDELRQRFAFEKDDLFLYCGTANGWVYLYQRGPWWNRSYKIQSDSIDIITPFPLGTQSPYKLHWGIFDESEKGVRGKTMSGTNGT
jgi:hypothetical protein